MTDEFVTMAGVRMDRPGFVIARNLTPLLGRGGLRGEDLTVETAPGDIPKPRVQGAFQTLLQFILYGQVDAVGNPHPSRRIGVRANLEFLYATHYTGLTIPIVHEFEDLSTREGTCLIEGISHQAHDSPQKGDVLRLTYDIKVHAGFLAAP